MDSNRLATARFYILFFLILVVPLFYAEPLLLGIEFPEAFNFPKHYLAQIGALFIFILFCLELAGRTGLRLAWGKAAGIFALLILWSFISLLYTPGFHTGGRECGRFCILWLIFVSAMNDCRSVDRVRKLATAACVSASLVSVAAVLQFSGLDYPAHGKTLYKVYSTLGNPNYIASYLAIILPIAYFGWTYGAGGRRASCLFIFLGIAGTAALFATGSRGGMASLFITAFVSVRILRLPLKRSRLYMVLSAVAVMFVLIYLPSPLNKYNTAAVSKISDISRSPRSGTAWRIMAWKIGWETALQHPLLGSGIGSLNVLYIPQLARFLNRPGNEAFLQLPVEGIDYLHQEYLQAWVELGLPGLFLLLWFLWLVLRSGFRAAAETKAAGPLIPAFFTGCIAFMIEAMVAFPLHLWASATAFIIFAGILAGRQSAIATIHIRRPLLRAAFVILCCAIFLVLLVSSVRTVVSEAYCGEGMRDFFAGKTDAALGKFTESARLQPQNGRARSFLGVCLAREKKYPEALRELLSALATYDHPGLYIEIGRLYLALGNKREAAHFLDSATRIRPLDYEAWLEKGGLLYGDKDLAGAASCYERALQIEPGSGRAALNLAITYHAAGRLDEALRTYELAIRLGIKDSDIYSNMGSIMAARGEKEKARSLWTKALDINPHDRNALENLKRLKTRPGPPD